MRFGKTLQATIREHGDTNIEVAREIAHVDNSTLGKYMAGSRNIPGDVMMATTRHYDDAKLYMAAANEATGGAWVPFLDNTDLHRANTHLKTLEEIEEAEEALKFAPITKQREQMTEEERQRMKRAIMECIEAITALTHHVGVLCKEYAFSWFAMWSEHRLKLKESKYLK